MNGLLGGNLKEIFGNEYTIDETELISYSTDASCEFGKAKAIVFPTENKQITKLINFANQYSFNLVPRGAGTGLCGGAVPTNSIVVDMSRMDKILEINIENKFAIVQAGIVLEDLNKLLEKEGLQFPIIPSSHEVVTLGGMAATNAAGLRAVKYGNMHDWVISLKGIDGNGYEKLFAEKNDFIGSEGIFGIIYELKLKLTEIIKHTKTEVIVKEDIDELMKSVAQAKDNPDTVSVEFINKHAAPYMELEEKFYLFVEKESNESDDYNASELLHKREGISVMIGGKGYTITEDPKIPDDQIGKFVSWLETKEIPAFGHIGYGIIHPRFREDQKELIEEMFNFVLKLGGEISGEHGYGTLKKKFVNNELKIKLSELKKKYDPRNIINPGKIIK